ncbi:hypothetical protein C8A03DRAFT_44132 [Achaetomium macrosporum]|uniref:Mitochondrial fission 1 protein n=1 Tax=Achaetomium macrosporum TaxID=79813 RepID=A0AAN7CA40_9PEZI|nr:hypothetical protein C8A03DRAFT_44132 [Achaetomium macrosporum]
MTQLPYAIDAETPLNPAELAVLRAQYEKEGEMVGVQTKFNYAWGLVKSNTRSDQHLGVMLLSEIFRTSPERRRECLYYLALGNYKLGNYGEARRYNDLLLEKEPGNLQATNLRSLIDDKVAREGLMGVAIVSGVAVVAGILGEPSIFEVFLGRALQRHATYLPGLGNTEAHRRFCIMAIWMHSTATFSVTPPWPVVYSMASTAGGVESVFCHACQSDWYRNEHESLICPSCGSSFTEIVSESIDFNNDPREGHGMPRRGWDSDPEEADILEHLRDESPFSGDRTNLSDAGLGHFARMLGGFGGARAGTETAEGPSEPRSRLRDRGEGPDLVGGDAILRHFAEILNDFETSRAPRGNPEPGARTLHTTVRTGPFGTQTRVTITSGTVRSGPQVLPNFGTYVIPRRTRIGAIALINNNIARANPNDLSRLFGQLFGSPWVDELDQRERRGGEPGSPFGGGLHDFLESLYNPAAAVHGDAVFTQEALDRIITQLMEASPHTNGAPPASQAAIESLQKKRVDEEMLGADGKAECTICMDEISKGAEVTVLPCKHWYHGECVVLWLREHNTCPVCRMSIDNREGGNNSGNARRGSQQAQSSQQASDSASTSGSSSSSSSRFARARDRNQEDLERLERLERLNSLRNPSSAERRFESRDSRRRNSHSPPNPWSSSEAGTRSRPTVYRGTGRPGVDYGEHYGGGGRRGVEREQLDRDTDSATTQTTLSSGPSTQIGTPTLTPHDNEPAKDESTTLSRELADLHVLRVQLAELEKEVSNRETWLAEATGLKPSYRPSSSIAECDSLRCFVQALLRKAAYAASAVLNTDSSNNNNNNDADITHSSNRNATSLVTIPLPLWRTDDGTRTAHPTSPAMSAPIPADRDHRPQPAAEVEDEFVGGIDDSPVALFILLVGFVALACLGMEIIPYCCCRVERGGGNLLEIRGTGGLLPPPVTATGRPGWWRTGFWERRGGGQIRLREEDGNRNGYGYECRDEKDGCYLDEKTAPHALYEDGGDDEDGESDVKSESGCEAEEEEEELTLGEELASFRAALDLVEGIVAAEEQRARRGTRESEAFR